MTARMLIYSRETGKDLAPFKKYIELSAPVMQQYGGRLVVLPQTPTVLEGDWPWQSAIVTEWPSREAAIEYYNSKEYQKARKHREGLKEYQIVLVDCVD
jgi:uncharacterized protein (DUF1330 family)